MKSLSVTTLLFLSLIPYSAWAASEGTYLTNSIDDCMSLQRLFRCTACQKDGDVTFPYDPAPTAPLAPTTITYELVTCDFAGKCPDGVVKNKCAWQRAMYFRCATDSAGQVFYVIGTNSLPNHCYYAEHNQPIGSDTEFQGYGWAGAFNLPYKQMDNIENTDDGWVATVLDDQANIDTQLCDGAWAKH